MTRETGVLAKGGEEALVEGIERAAVELLCLGPQRAEIGDDRRPPLTISQDVDAACPIAKLKPEVREHAVGEARPKDAGTAPAFLLGPVVA